MDTRTGLGSFDRRRFLGTSAAASASLLAATLVPTLVLGENADEAAVDNSWKPLSQSVIDDIQNIIQAEGMVSNVCYRLGSIAMICRT